MVAEASQEDPSQSFRKEASTSEASESLNRFRPPLMTLALMTSQIFTTQHEVWNPNFKMYKHVKTQVVHLLADGTTHNSFSCGLKLRGDYTQVDSSRFLDLRKCRRCDVAKPIKDVGH